MNHKTLKRIRVILAFFITAMVISGLTAIPIEPQLKALLGYTPQDSSLHYWLTQVLQGYTETSGQYPFLLYGYDWLAFAHFVLAILFIGPYRDPLRNIWVIEFGMIACVLVLPTAFIAGHFRGIPVGWRLIDCCFGVVGFAVLFACRHLILQLQPTPATVKQHSYASVTV
jgi:hypothetical protein